MGDMMRTAMPKLCGSVAMLGLSVFILGGCVAHRQPQVVIDPEYSYLRDGDLTATGPATLVGDELAVDLTVDENGLLQPATFDAGSRLVRANAAPTVE